MSDDLMLRKLIRDRLNEGKSGAEIRTELEAYGLNAQQIQMLAQDVSGNGECRAETLFEWVPMMLLPPAGAALVALYATATKPTFAIGCFLMGMLVGTITSFMMRTVATNNAPSGAKSPVWGTIGQNPTKYIKFFFPIFVSWCLSGAAVALDPEAVEHFQREGVHFQK